MANVPEMMTRAEADLREAEAASAAAQERATQAQADAAVAAQRAKEMRAVLGWLQTQSAQPAAPAEAPGRPQGQPATRFGRPIPEVPQTDLCLQALESIGRSATTREIRERLARDGHDLTQAQVRAAMKYLSKKSTSPVETAGGSGMWRLRRPKAAPFQSDTMTGTPAVNGAGRGS